MRNYNIGDIVYFKHYTIGTEEIRHPYLIVKIKLGNLSQKKSPKYCLISLSSNIGSSKKNLSLKVKKETNNYVLIIEPKEAKGLTKRSMVRLTPLNTIMYVPHEELTKKGHVYSKSKVTRAKNIFKQILSKTAKNWNSVNKVFICEPKYELVIYQNEREKWNYGKI